MQEEMVVAIVGEWFKKMNKKMPELTFTGNNEGNNYSFTLSKRIDDLVFFIKEGTDEYQVGLFADYAINITADCSALGLHLNEVNDYDSGVDNWYDDLANDPIAQWVHDIPMNPPAIRPSDETIIDDAIDEWIVKHEGSHTVDDLVQWYISAVYIPAFMDQTEKHMIKEIAAGIPEFVIEDVVQYWEQQMAIGESIECLLDEVDNYYENK